MATRPQEGICVSEVMLCCLSLSRRGRFRQGDGSLPNESGTPYISLHGIRCNLAASCVGESRPGKGFL